MSDFESKYHTHSYEHPVFKPGTLIYVDPSIRDIHEQSQVAGMFIEACEGTYPYSDDPSVQRYIDAEEQARPHETLVPVRISNNLLFVEQEYVKLASDV